MSRGESASRLAAACFALLTGCGHPRAAAPAPPINDRIARVEAQNAEQDKQLAEARAQVEDLDRAIARARERAADAAIDATAVRASLLDHSYFAENPVILEDLREILIEQLTAAKRLITLHKNGDVWVPIIH
jgi:septal ring factor EnvC (AmiA/AmiB activator)